MVINKKFKIIISVVILISLCSLLIVFSPNKASLTNSTSTNEPDYVSTIFDKDKVIEINIEIDEADWKNMLDTAIEETYTSADITVNGTTYSNVAIRPKGNSSLSQIYNDDTTDRYSFKIKFDKYVDGQTLDGLSKLVLNNGMSDTTYMKEYLSYDLLSSLNVPTPAYAFANVSVNGEEWGLYLAVEPIEEEFIERYYGDVSGNLYKPESDSVAVGDKDAGGMMNKPIQNTNEDSTTDSTTSTTPTDVDKNWQNQAPPNMNGEAQNGMPTDMPQGEMPTDMPQGEIPADMPQGNIPTDMPQGEMPTDIPQGEMPADIPQGEIPTDMPQNGAMQGGGMGGGMNKNSAGADLVWNGDDISNYSAIFDNTEFKSTTTEDYQKILDMIEHLDSMEDIESYLNVDEVLRYFAANTFLVNLDSYTSNMKHNYYLYEEDGIVSILPWDYNLSFGAFMAGSASNVINFPIDSPVSDSLENSPLIGKLLEVDEYKELYHKYLNEIVENYINNGTYEETINKVHTLISNYVKNDATAFYTFDEYTNSISNLITFGKDRATSISAQLDGSQPSTTAGTIETTLDLTSLGQQGGGKGGMDKGGMGMQPTDMPNRDVMMQAMQIIQSSTDGTITDEIKEQLKELGLTDENIEQLTNMKKPNQ